MTQSPVNLNDYPLAVVPEPLARDEEKGGRLRIKRVAEPKQEATQYLAWRTGAKGKALSWWIERLDPKACAARWRASA